jgi:DNA gyrase subunit A
VISTIPVIDTDQIVMVSDGGQLIRLPVGGISFTGRSARGVTLFRVGDGERVVSVTRFREVGGPGTGGGEPSADEAAEPDVADLEVPEPEAQDED